MGRLRREGCMCEAFCRGLVEEKEKRKLNPKKTKNNGGESCEALLLA